MQVVEMLGIPGSGKTTAATGLRAALPGSLSLEEAVLDAVRRRGEDGVARIAARVSRSPDSRLWKSAYARSSDRFSALTRFVDERRSLLEAVLSAQRQREERDRRQDLVLGWLLNLMARYQLATEIDRSGWLVVDEGFLQRGVALVGHGFEEADRELLQSYLDAIPIPAAVVVVQTPATVASGRLDQRGWSERIADADPAAKADFLEGASHAVEAVEAFARESSIPVFEVDGTVSGPDSYVSISATLTD